MVADVTVELKASIKNGKAFVKNMKWGVAWAAASPNLFHIVTKVTPQGFVIHLLWWWVLD